MSNQPEKYKDLTDEQKQVIKHKQGNLLVSASAGSGKTKVLITKIVDIVLNKLATLKQLLVVTFTNDASAEMKIRLSNELQNSNDAYLQQQLDDLSTSDILTFDKFCIKVVREFGYQVGMTNNFSVADDSLSKFLQSKALDNIFTKLNKNSNETYNNLLEQFFGSRNFTALKNGIVKIFNFLRSKSMHNNHYKNLLEDMFSQDFNKSEAIKYANQIILAEKTNFVSKLQTCLIEAQQLQSNCLQKIITDWLAKAELLNDSFENNYHYLCNGFGFARLPNKKLTADEEDLKKKIAGIKDKFNSNIGKFVENKKVELAQIKKDIITTKQNLILVYNLVEEFDKEYKKLKDHYQVLDFADIEGYAEILLQNPQIKLALQNRYKYIFIDEYQDTNEMQDNIIKNISTGDNLLMVGDVKQSIYRFRQAEPKIFLNKYNLYKDFQNTNSIVELNKNFRSESDILNFANFVFEGIMHKQNSGVDYKNTAKLEFGGTMQKSSPTEQVKIIAIHKSTNKNGEEELDLDDKDFSYYSVKDADLTYGEYTKVQKEAKVIAQEINNIIGKQYYDAKSKQYKTIDFKDIAILSRRKSGVTLLVRDILKKSGIPVNCTYKTELYKNYDIQIIINILKLIQNCQDDTALMSTLCLPQNKLTFNELAHIRATFKDEKFFYQAVEKYVNSFNDIISQKILNCFDKIKKYKVLSNSKNLKELILHIVQAEDLENYFVINNQGEDFNCHLDLLLNSLNSIKEYSLTEYINYISTFASQITFDVTISDSANSVEINTIHSSKGLEYPVVFLMDTGTKFGDQSIKESILTENDFGISCKTYNSEKRIAYSSPFNQSFKRKITEEERKEEMRLLYVALTRPKNYLFVVGTTDLQKVEKLQTPQDVLETNSYLKWILGLFEVWEVESLFLDGSLNKLCNNTNVLCQSYNFNQIDVQEQQVVEDFASETHFSNNFTNIINKKFDKNNLVKKSSVSQIMAEEEHYNISDFTSKITDKINDDDFLIIGTVYHKFMEHINFTADEQNTLNQIQNLQINNVIAKHELQLIDTNSIVKASSNIAKYIDTADTVLKEQQFLCYMPANMLINTTYNNKVLVQGVADLIIIKQNEIYLIDYKTSRISNEQKFKQKYQTQLNIYAKAIESFYKKPVTKKMIYSFYLNKEIII